MTFLWEKMTKVQEKIGHSTLTTSRKISMLFPFQRFDQQPSKLKLEINNSVRLGEKYYTEF